MTSNPAAKHRILAIDVLRGLVMVVMTVDHAREYAAGPGGLGDPMDLEQVTPLLYGMRWISHFCAPVFTFLMGVSAYLSVARRTPAEATRQMLIRGAILLALEFTIVAWAWTFNPLWPRKYFQVIGALGVGMLVLAFAVRWPRAVVAAVGACICLGHNLLDGIRFAEGSVAHYAWSFLHQKNVLPLFAGFEVRTTYPVLPIVGLALLGYAAGPWFRNLALPDAKRLLARTGIVLCIAFLALRIPNLYGDSSQFVLQDNWLHTLFSLGNVTKYPLSLQFMLMTIGPALLFLAATLDQRFERMRGLVTLGQTPFFYYVGHLYLLHVLALAGALAAGYSLGSFNVFENFGGVPPRFGFPLWATVPFSLATTGLLMPACEWYAKERKRRRWLRYL